MAKTDQVVKRGESALDRMLREAREEDVDVRKAGRGLELADSKDLVVPRLALAQSMTPQAKKSDPLYIPGLEEGLWFNSVTRKIYGEGPLTIVPIFMFKSAVNADDDGNLICRSDDAVNCSNGGRCQCETWRQNPNGGKNLPPPCTKFLNYVVYLHEDPGMPLVLSFKRTSMDVAKNWTTKMKLFRGRDIWETAWNLTAVAESSGDYSWMAPKLDPFGWTKSLDGGEVLISFCEQAYTDFSKRPNVVMDTTGLEKETRVNDEEVPF